MRPVEQGAAERTHILLVGIDGLRLSVARRLAVAPTMQRLIEEGSLHGMRMEVPTWSGPGWSSILTGRTHAEHGVRDNSFVGHRLYRYPDLLSLAFYRDQTTRTFAAASWPPLVAPDDLGPVIHQRREQQMAGLHRVIARDGETYGYRTTDSEVADAAVAQLSQGGFDVGFVYFCGVDEAGHVYGLLGEEYPAAITRVDRYLGRLVEEVRRRQAGGERWLVAVVTDHGHRTEGGHGGATEAERASFVLSWSPSGRVPDWPERIEPHEVAGLLLEARDGAGNQ